MNPYTILSSGLGIQEAAALSARLSAWHDTMVTHERRLRADTTNGACDDDCPHADARALWSEAVATFCVRAQELTFLRSRAQETHRLTTNAQSTHARSEPVEYARRRAPESRADTTTMSPVTSAVAAAEF